MNIPGLFVLKGLFFIKCRSTLSDFFHHLLFSAPAEEVMLLDITTRHTQISISMDGRGRAKDNIWIEGFWKTIKYEYIYIQPNENGSALYNGIKRFIGNYNYHRRHQGIDRQVPSKLCYICGKDIKKKSNCLYK